VFPYFSLAKGFLTGKYRSANDEHANNASPRAAQALHYLTDRGNAVLEALTEISTGKGVPMAAVSLAWLRQQPGVTMPISSARNAEQLDGILTSMRVTLTDDELAELDRASSVEDTE